MQDQSKIIIRKPTDADMIPVQKIYSYHVLNGVESFEDSAPDVPEIIRRRDEISAKGYPYYVAELAGEIIGYAYASPYRPRPAYRFTVENSVYMSPDAVRLGGGSALLAALIERCTTLGYRQMIAVISAGEQSPSYALHAKLGFVHMGQTLGIGFKLGHWVDVITMQLALGEGDSTPPTQ